MRHAVFALLAAVVLTASSGCGLCDQMFCFHKPWGGCGNGGCGNGGCGNGGCGAGGCANGACGGDGYAHSMVPRGEGGTNVGAEGPPTGAVAYPYYTSRGPRDFLTNNPPSIGP
jgi:hypothetical protein